MERDKQYSQNITKKNWYTKEYSYFGVKLYIYKKKSISKDNKLIWCIINFVGKECEWVFDRVVTKWSKIINEVKMWGVRNECQGSSVAYPTRYVSIQLYIEKAETLLQFHFAHPTHLEWINITLTIPFSAFLLYPISRDHIYLFIFIIHMIQSDYLFMLRPLSNSILLHKR